MVVFPSTGEAGLYVKYSGDLIDASMSLDSSLVQIPDSATHYVRFNSGVATLIKGTKLTGQTSAATMDVVSVVVTAGTLAGNDGQGIVFIKNLSGTITNTENLRIATTTQCVAESAEIVIRYRGLPAKSVFMSVETNSIRLMFNGSTPTNAAQTPASYGHLVQANENVEIVGWENIKNLKFINAASGSNSIVNITIQF